MISSLNNNLSALNAFSTQMGVNSNNIANFESEEFDRSRTVINEGQNNAVNVNISQVESQGPIRMEFRDGGETEVELSNVELAEEMTTMISTQRGYEANLKPIQAGDEMLGTVIDMVS